MATNTVCCYEDVLLLRQLVPQVADEQALRRGGVLQPREGLRGGQPHEPPLVPPQLGQEHLGVGVGVRGAGSRWRGRAAAHWHGAGWAGGTGTARRGMHTRLAEHGGGAQAHPGASKQGPSGRQRQQRRCWDHFACSMARSRPLEMGGTTFSCIFAFLQALIVVLRVVVLKQPGTQRGLTGL